MDQNAGLRNLRSGFDSQWGQAPFFSLQEKKGPWVQRKETI